MVASIPTWPFPVLKLFIHTTQTSMKSTIRVARRVANVLSPSLLWISKVMPPSVFKLHIRVVTPRPIIKLKAGPAMQPVSAISPNPFLAIERQAKQSPRLLPHESTVKPSRDVGNCVKIPKSSSKSTITSQRMAIQTMLMKKLESWKRQIILRGGAVVLCVRNLMPMPMLTLTKKHACWIGS